jgi:hypothetical protein
MKRNLTHASLFLVVLSGLAFGPELSLVPGLISGSHAIVGAPRTPLSVAGVARRTAYRGAVATTTAVAASSAAASQQATAAQQQAAVAQQQAAAAQQQAAAAEAEAAAAKHEAEAAKRDAAAAKQAGALPPGTTVSALPSGCNTLNIAGVDYFNCAGTYYRVALQSNQVVYVVSVP